MSWKARYSIFGLRPHVLKPIVKLAFARKRILAGADNGYFSNVFLHPLKKGMDLILSQ